MANQVLKFADRVAESTVSTGTGDIELSGAIDSDHESFGNQFSDGDVIPCVVFGGGQWMTFIGTYNSGTDSLTRTTFKDSSTGSNISLSGTMTVLCAWGAQSLFDMQKFFTLTDAATVAVDLSKFINAKVTLGGNRALGAPTNCVEGQSGVIQVIQDGTGSRTMTFDAAWDFGVAGDPTLSTTAATVDLIAYCVIDAATPVVRCSFIGG